MTTTNAARRFFSNRRAFFSCSQGRLPLYLTQGNANGVTEMATTMMTLIRLAAQLLNEGKTNEEIRKELFKVKGSKVSQIKQVMDMMEY